jgi:hypothetical protein
MFSSTPLQMMMSSNSEADIEQMDIAYLFPFVFLTIKLVTRLPD